LHEADIATAAEFDVVHAIPREGRQKPAKPAKSLQMRNPGQRKNPPDPRRYPRQAGRGWNVAGEVAAKRRVFRQLYFPRSHAGWRGWRG
jgi:hypothetical protein